MTSGRKQNPREMDRVVFMTAYRPALPGVTEPIPVLYSMAPPEAAASSWKFSTPAIASEPYCAAAPSRNTSTYRSAMAKIAMPTSARTRRHCFLHGLLTSAIRPGGETGAEQRDREQHG